MLNNQKIKNANLSECAVVIPIYKEDLTADEEKSLCRCLSVLGEYPIIFAAPRRLNCEKYARVCSEYKSFVSYELFKNRFFNGFNAYNALMLSSEFYGRFLNYNYILIYQLDAFVFKNDLAFWCKQGYDYIGGAHFDVQRGACAPRRTTVLNGGFSLRKTDRFYTLAKANFRLHAFLYLCLSKHDAIIKKPTAFNILMAEFLFAGAKLLRKILRFTQSEDFDWSLKIEKFGKIAPFSEALRFSFDACPEYAYKENGEALPFGCHGWTAYYNRLFWEKFI